jgi:hypothetical protein
MHIMFVVQCIKVLVLKMFDQISIKIIKCRRQHLKAFKMCKVLW